MGVNGLWKILSSCGQPCTLSDLRDLKLAVDLSGWVCESCSTKGLSSAVNKPHIRNLLFRLIHLYVDVGAELVFVVDGFANPMKWDVMNQRMGVTCSGRNTGVRHWLNEKVQECCELLDAIGIPYVTSRGEAEALCALLNKEGVVDGVISEDSDTFLYGAKVVFRQFSTTKEAEIMKFTMEQITKELALTCEDLVLMSVLLGCDFMPQGVPGVGKETVMKAVKEGGAELRETIMGGGLRDHKDPPKHVRRIYEKIKDVPGYYPKAVAVMKEYLGPLESIPRDVDILKTRRMPNIISMKEIIRKHLEWKDSYTLEKCSVFLTSWVLREKAAGKEVRNVIPLKIEGEKKRCGVQRFEVEWMTNLILYSDPELTWSFVTFEEVDVFKTCYPDICEIYYKEKERQKMEKEVEKREKLRDKKNSPGKQKQTYLCALEIPANNPSCSKRDSVPINPGCDDLSVHSFSISRVVYDLSSPPETPPRASSDTSLSTPAKTSPLGKRDYQSTGSFSSPSKLVLLESPDKSQHVPLPRKINFNDTNSDEVQPLLERLKMSSPLKQSKAFVGILPGDSDACPIVLDD